MATFTLELREVIEHLYGTSYDKADFQQQYAPFTFDGVTYGKLPVIEPAENLGLGTYPIFDEGYRPILNGKIVDEFYTREICTETIDNWQLIMRRKMDQIMPYYNKLYLSEQIDYSALATMDIHSVGENTLTGKETTRAEATNESRNESKSRAVNSTFPQTVLAGNEDYATGATDGYSETDGTGTSVQDGESEVDNTTNNDNRVTGYQGIASDLVMRYRNSLLNIDTMILNEIQDCFMMILNNGDEYAARNYEWWF